MLELYFLLRTFCFTTSSKLYVITAPAADPPLIAVCNPTHERLHKFCAGSSGSSPENKTNKTETMNFEVD